MLQDGLSSIKVGGILQGMQNVNSEREREQVRKWSIDNLFNNAIKGNVMSKYQRNILLEDSLNSAGCRVGTVHFENAKA